MRELERCDSAFRSVASVQGSLVMYPIFTYGTDKQKDFWLERLGTGDAVGAFALSEPQGGSDPAAMLTVAEDCGSHWKINGAKKWVTNGTICDALFFGLKLMLAFKGFCVRVILREYTSKISIIRCPFVRQQVQNVPLKMLNSLRMRFCRVPVGWGLR